MRLGIQFNFLNYKLCDCLSTKMEINIKFNILGLNFVTHNKKKLCNIEIGGSHLTWNDALHKSWTKGKHV